MYLIKCGVTAIAIFVLPLSDLELNAQEQQEGLVETRILENDPQSGMKSQHFYFVDFNARSVTSAFETGTTHINLGVVKYEVSSIRDNFRVTSVDFVGDLAKFTLIGTTASGVRIVPDIDYRLDFEVSKTGGLSIAGCHDGYPAYLIQHEGKDVYAFEHKSLDLIKLFGTCDVQITTN